MVSTSFPLETFLHPARPLPFPVPQETAGSRAPPQAMPLQCTAMSPPCSCNTVDRQSGWEQLHEFDPQEHCPSGVRNLV